MGALTTVCQEYASPLMLQFVVETALGIAALYLLAGVAAAAYLHSGGLRRIDPAVEGAGWFFKSLVTPGLIALWPVMLRKLRRAGQGQETAGQPDRPVSARGLRKTHGSLIRLLAVVLPIVVGGGIAGRNADHATSKSFPFDPALDALPNVVATYPNLFNALPITVRAREDAARAQLELEVREDLEIPSLALYWMSGSETNITPGNAIYLGAVWGPTVRRFDLPDGALEGANTVLLYSLARSEPVAVAVLPGRE